MLKETVENLVNVLPAGGLSAPALFGYNDYWYVRRAAEAGATGQQLKTIIHQYLKKHSSATDVRKMLEILLDHGYDLSILEELGTSTAMSKAILRSPRLTSEQKLAYLVEENPKLTSAHFHTWAASFSSTRGGFGAFDDVSQEIFSRLVHAASGSHLLVFLHDHQQNLNTQNLKEALNVVAQKTGLVVTPWAVPIDHYRDTDNGKAGHITYDAREILEHMVKLEEEYPQGTINPRYAFELANTLTTYHVFSKVYQGTADEFSTITTTETTYGHRLFTAQSRLEAATTADHTRIYKMAKAVEQFNETIRVHRVPRMEDDERRRWEADSVRKAYAPQAYLLELDLNPNLPTIIKKMSKGQLMCIVRVCPTWSVLNLVAEHHPGVFLEVTGQVAAFGHKYAPRIAPTLQGGNKRVGPSMQLLKMLPINVAFQHEVGWTLASTIDAIIKMFTLVATQFSPEGQKLFYEFAQSDNWITFGDAIELIKSATEDHQ